MLRKTRSSVLLSCLLSVGCDLGTGPAANPDPAIQTEGSSFNLRRQGNYLKVVIPHTFTNRTGATVYIQNCRGGFRITLDRREPRGVWKTAWNPSTLLCLGPPIVIEADETYHVTLQVSGGLPGCSCGPLFDKADPSGTYRIVWHHVLSSYQDRSGPLGDSIALRHRTSNQFTLTAF